ncbi:VanZ family protein, partial [Klebsiella pneumoniae]|nr:VanZ family protein [Klebsiella pneumoniae]
STGWLGFAASRAGVWALTLGLLAFGATIEAIQLAVPGRSGEWTDLLADAVGIASGLAIGVLFTQRRRGG